jgi:hypothetical integral membrane protein (TIGR02206 family)
MNEFFSYEYTGEPFGFLDSAHIIALASIAALNIFLLLFKNKDEATRKKVGIVLALSLWINESLWHIWNIVHGTWTIQELLPLHACSILIWLAGFMLINKNYRIYEFVYFMGISGALQALLTPNIGIYGYPHFRFFQTFVSHGLLVTSAIYMTTVEGMRPTWRSMLRVLVISNIYMGIVFVINMLIGSNYLYVAHKPPGPTLLDALPDWPWYLLYMEALGVVMMLLLYLPFIVKDWRQRRQVTPASPS